MDRKILRIRISVAATVSVLVLSAAACGPGLDSAIGGDDADLRVLVGPSDAAETRSVRAAVLDWSRGSGRGAGVGVSADLPRQLSQGFARGSPPDVFAVSTDSFASYAADELLQPYGDELGNTDDFYPTLVDTFTVDGELVCAPKSFSTLALIIDEQAWHDAGLAPGDYPTTWGELRDAAASLTTRSQVGLTFPPEWQRIGAFAAQSGGRLVDEALRPGADSPENFRALAFAKDLLTSGSAKFPSDIGADWGGEALGTGAAAMTVEDNRVVPALRDGYPDVDYAVVPLPSGPAGPGTLQFTECWGIAADAADHDAAVDLVRHLTSTAQQTAFAEDFGAMPTVRSAAAAWAEANPSQEAFLDGARYAEGVPPVVGLPDALAGVDALLEDLPHDDPGKILTAVQSALATVGE
ncbi:sugar ABC transporter substrate-binding protein [Myceligenerans cantabricum]